MWNILEILTWFTASIVCTQKTILVLVFSHPQDESRRHMNKRFSVWGMISSRDLFKPLAGTYRSEVLITSTVPQKIFNKESCDPDQEQCANYYQLTTTCRGEFVYKTWKCLVLRVPEIRGGPKIKKKSYDYIRSPFGVVSISRLENLPWSVVVLNLKCLIASFISKTGWSSKIHKWDGGWSVKVVEKKGRKIWLVMYTRTHQEMR